MNKKLLFSLLAIIFSSVFLGYSQTGFTCSNPIAITSIPYQTLDNTSNYGDTYDVTQPTTCIGGTSLNYMTGNDVFYSYTPSVNENLNIRLTPLAGWSGIFVYDGCVNVGVTCVAGVANSGSTLREIPQLAVLAGHTYIIAISTNATPQTLGYSLQIQATPNCLNPSQITLSSITSSGVNLSWNNPSNTTSWEVAVVANGNPIPANGTVTSSNVNFAVANLVPNSIYKAYVRSVCSDGSYSLWSAPISFSTLSSCAAPTQILSSTISSTSANFSWLLGTGNSGYQYAVQLSGITTLPSTGALVTTNAATVTGLSPSTSYKIYVRTVCANQTFSSWSVPITFTTSLSCLIPSQVTASTITETSATLSWLNTNVTSWEYVIQLASTNTIPTIGTSTTTNSVSLTNLTIGTSYRFYIRTLCTNQTYSSWTSTVFSTTATPIVQPVCGGTFVDNGGLIGSYSGNSDQTVTISPINAGDVVTVTFTEFNTENNWDGLYVFDGNSINAPIISSGNTGGNVPGGLPGSFSGITIPGPFTSTAQDGSLTFRFRSDPSVNNAGWNANVTCGLPPTCAKPNTLIVNYTNPTNVSLSWTEAGTATLWEVLALPLSSVSPTSTSQGIVTNSNPFIFDNLTASSYKFYVRAICSDTDNSNWSNPVFYTIPECLPPLNVFSSSITTTSATLNWISNNVASSYQILVQPNGTLAPNSNSTGFYTTSTTSFIVTGLTCLTAYDVYVRKVCSTTFNSNWSNVTTFSTLGINATVLLPSINQCDDNGDGFVIFNLTTQVTTTSNPLVYYTSILNATNQTNQILNPSSFVIPTSAPNTVIYVRESIIGNCDNMYSFQLGANSDCNLAHNCNLANSLCSALGNPFTNTHQSISAETGNGNNYGCLSTTPNPTWFYLPVSTAGTLNLTIEQSTTINFTTNNLDVDYIVYGPFTNPVTPCASGLNQSNTISCSFSAAPVEYPIIPNAQVGEYYLLMVTNFSNQPGFIRINMNTTSTGAIDCSGLRLNAFLDANTNGSQDNGEVNFPLGQFHYDINEGDVHNVIAPTGIYNIYDISGTNSYDFNYTINPEYSSMYSISNASYSNINVVIGGGMVTYNFPISIIQNYNDLAVALIPFNDPRAGTTYQNKLVYANVGNQTIPSGTVTFNNNNLTTIATISQTGTTSITNGFTYDFTNLLPFETREITITMQVPPIPTVAIGQLLTNTASIVPLTDDVVITNNTSSLTQAVIAAYDPNDKMESHGEKILFSSFNANDYLYYTIRFENTGNASAINVNVTDVLNSKIDELSVQMVSASHAYTMDRVTTGLNWNFNNIQLPVSVANTNIGKGYITFKAKLKPGFAVGDIIPNTASIFFDTNPAIITNTFNTEFVSALANANFNTSDFNLFPNPATNFVQIKLSNDNSSLKNIVIYDMIGKTIKSITNLNNNETIVDISNFSKGMYLVEITDDNLQKIVKKLIVE